MAKSFRIAWLKAGYDPSESTAEGNRRPRLFFVFVPHSFQKYGIMLMTNKTILQSFLRSLKGFFSKKHLKWGVGQSPMPFVYNLGTGLRTVRLGNFMK